MPGQVAAPTNGIQNISDLLALLGGTKTSTTTTGDTANLSNSIAALKGMDPNALLQSIFQQAAGQIPGLSAARANAVGARTGQNSPLGVSLDKLMQDTAIKAQGQVADQQLKNQQLQIQAGSQIANSNRNQTQQQGTNLQKAGQLLAIAGGAQKLFDSNIGKQIVGKTKSIWDSVTGGGDALSSVSSAAPAFDSIGDQAFELAGSAAGSIGDAAAPAFDAFDVFNGIGDAASAGGDLLTSVTPDIPIDDISGFFGMKDGGLVGREYRNLKVDQAFEDAGSADEGDGRKAAIAAANAKAKTAKSGAAGPKLSDYDKDSKMVDKGTGIRFADGGVVPGKDVNQHLPGGRVGTGAQYTTDGITLAQALQNRNPLLNPEIIRQLITANPESVGSADNPGNTAPAGGFAQGLSGMAGPLGGFIGATTGVPGTSVALNAILGLVDHADQQAQLAKDNQEAIQFANAHEGQSSGLGGMGQNSGGGLGGIGTAATAGAPIGVDMGTNDSTGLGMGQGPGGGGIGSGATSDGGIGGASGDGPGYRQGGNVQGKGTGTSDSIPAMLSDNEYVIPADVVQKLGVGFFDQLRAAFHTPVGV